MELNNNTDDGLPLQYVLQNMPIKGSMAVFSENVCTGTSSFLLNEFPFLKISCLIR